MPKNEVGHGNPLIVVTNQGGTSPAINPKKDPGDEIFSLADFSPSGSERNNPQRFISLWLHLVRLRVEIDQACFDEHRETFSVLKLLEKLNLPLNDKFNLSRIGDSPSSNEFKDYFQELHAALIDPGNRHKSFAQEVRALAYMLGGFGPFEHPDFICRTESQTLNSDIPVILWSRYQDFKDGLRNLLKAIRVDQSWIANEFNAVFQESLKPQLLFDFKYRFDELVKSSRSAIREALSMAVDDQILERWQSGLFAEAPHYKADKHGPRHLTDSRLRFLLFQFERCDLPSLRQICTLMEMRKGSGDYLFGSETRNLADRLAQRQLAIGEFRKSY